MDAWLVPGSLFVLGTTFVGGSMHNLAKTARLRRRGVATTGVVIAQSTGFAAGSDSTPGAGPLAYSPVVRFTAQNGQVIEVTPSVRKTHSSFVPGRPVTVYYDPRNPRDAVIPAHDVGTTYLFLGIGALLLLGCIGILAWRALDVELSGPAANLPFGLIPVGLGIVFTGIALAGIAPVVRLHRRGIRGPALVVGETVSSDSNGLPLHHPVVRFALPDGQAAEVPSYRGTLARRATPGRQVTVRYDPADPGRVLLAGDGPSPVYIVFGVAGPLIFGIGIAITYALVNA